MARVVGVALLMLALVGAGPATAPSRLNGTPAILAAIPKKLQPPANDPTSLQLANANKWIAENLPGAEIKLKCKFIEASESTDGKNYNVSVEVPECRANPYTLLDDNFTFSISKNEAGDLARLKHQQQIEVTGVLGEFFIGYIELGKIKWTMDIRGHRIISAH